MRLLLGENDGYIETWFSKRRWQHVSDHPLVFASFLILALLIYLLKDR